MKIMHLGWNDRSLMLTLCFLYTCHCTGTSAQETELADKVDFEIHVASILRDQCVECHNQSIEMAALRLDNSASAFASGIIDPGDSENSLLIQRLHDQELGITMPPGGKLSGSDIGTLKRWIDQGAEWPDNVVLSSVGEATKEGPVARALFAAIRSAELRSVKRIVRKRGYSDELLDQYGSTALHHAAWVGSVNTLRYLISEGADVSLANQSGVTPLMLAVGSLAKIEMLLEKGADVNACTTSQRTPLMLAAARSNNSAVLKRLISAGADVNAKDGRNWTALIKAARTGDARMLQVLLDAGANVNDGNGNGLRPGTALTQAAWTGDLDSVTLLLDAEPISRAIPLTYH